MQFDIFAKRRNQTLLFFTVLTLLTVGSIIITKFEVVKGFTSIAKAFTWGVSNFYPDAASMKKLPDIFGKLVETILMSVASTTVGSVLALFLALMGSKVTGTYAVFKLIARGIASFFRNIPVVAWAMVLMLSFSQSPMTGFLALLVGSVGFLTRAFIETVDEVSNNSVEALQATGARYFHIIFNAVLPASLPQMTSWILYMVETNIRDATLVGILTGTGIGFSFELYYKSLNYHAASLVVVLIVITVIAIESVSNAVRRIIL